jgi:protein-L-isoaspartate(D-aspartate) O-methyltransferase
VLAHVFPEVYSIERSRACSDARRRNLPALRLRTCALARRRYAGLERAAPFQAIIVAAAAPRLPEALLRQLAPGGRMVLPLVSDGGQRLLRVERRGRGFVESELDAVRFVPMEAGKA